MKCRVKQKELEEEIDNSPFNNPMSSSSITTRTDELGLKVLNPLPDSHIVLNFNFYLLLRS